jgi:hypothetical protein
MKINDRLRAAGTEIRSAGGKLNRFLRKNAAGE